MTLDLASGSPNVTCAASRVRVDAKNTAATSAVDVAIKEEEGEEGEDEDRIIRMLIAQKEKESKSRQFQAIQDQKVRLR